MSFLRAGLLRKEILILSLGFRIGGKGTTLPFRMREILGRTDSFESSGKFWGGKPGIFWLISVENGLFWRTSEVRMVSF